ncbi:hypothetical protein [Arthrobacter sp. CDRTa11]|uniref:hypothetical protein n=1 Tax=Arthrobacter sp. CDRTa11 TaxID=2651199 RepID=UPI0022659E9D|nr:hypothetical protein [Arthrobacter sp. CDRTa11]
MNIRPERETSPEIPEADALEQQTPVLPGGSENELMDPLPIDAPEVDVMEQHADVLPGGAEAGITAVAEADAAEADLVEQAMALSLDDEEDYREGRDEAD